jgi:hypothetical protein
MALRLPTTRYLVLPQGPYREASDCAQKRLHHLDQAGEASTPDGLRVA